MFDSLAVEAAHSVGSEVLSLLFSGEPKVNDVIKRIVAGQELFPVTEPRGGSHMPGMQHLTEDGSWHQSKHRACPRCYHVSSGRS